MHIFVKQDAQIAAVARVNDLVLLTDDKHFAFVDGVAVEI